jgi:hypothetical protein
MSKVLQEGMWNLLCLYRSGTLQNLIQETQEYKIGSWGGVLQ